MALTRGLFIVLLGATLPLLFFSHAVVGEVGVNYGRVANNLPPNQASVVQLLKQNGITKVRIYDAYPPLLSCLANTGIKVMVMMPNENLADAAKYQAKALQWVQRNVAPYYPATHIDGIAVGNEVFDSMPKLTSKLVPAMINVQRALAQLGLADAIKVSTPINFDALNVSFPPSAGRFKEELQPVMKSMLDFLQRTGSYLTMNIYPFFAYAAQPDQIPLDYALGNSNPGVCDDNTGLTYYSLLDAQRDAAYYAVEDISNAMGKMGATEASAVGSPGGSLSLTESGWPSGGKVSPGGRRRLLQDGSGAASIANAQAYNNNLINRVLSCNTGTPHRPETDLDVYIFALFNENQKGRGPDDVEQHFGLFYPNMKKVYEFDFHGGDASTESWCVANEAVGDARLQEALDYACQNGADCSAIQPGGTCFEPNTKIAHASYAFNSYYQSNGRESGACDFSGAGTVVYEQPKFGNCLLPSTG